MFRLPWTIFVDTSRKTDYFLSLFMTFLAGGVTLVVTARTGGGGVTAALAAVTAALIGTSWYARRLWKQEQSKRTPTRIAAVKLRAPR